MLKLTKNGSVKLEDVKNDARVPSSSASFLLAKLQSEGLVYVNGTLVEADAAARLKLAVKAAQMGADVERVSDFLGWQEFESMAAHALEINEYSTFKNVHFTFEKKLWEIDVVACKKPLVICVDCKQWHHGMHASSLRKMVEQQEARADQFARALPLKKADFPCTRWDSAVFVPVILSLTDINVRFVDEVPIVPVLRFQDFLCQLPLNLTSVTTFRRKFEHL